MPLSIWSATIRLSILFIPLPTARVSGAGLNRVKEVPSPKLGQAQTREGQKEYDNASPF
jgi:hypothetical protein